MSVTRPLVDTALDGIFNPRSVAIYGISDRTSGRIAENMTVQGVPFYGINPTRDEACGMRCYPSIGDCPAVPEMVVMGVGHGRIEAAVDDVLSVEGVRAIITPGLGNEAGAEGPEVSARVSAKVAERGIAMLGPNCMGVATPGYPSPWIGSLHPTFVPGPVATLAHSGSIGEILVSLGPRVGFRTVISSGNESVTDVADFVAYFAQDEATRVVGLFLEGVRRPAAFEESLRLLAEAGKVAIVLKVGTSEMGAQAALAHTGALVGSDRSFSAMLRHYNAIRVDDFSEWIEHLEVFSRKKPPRGARIGAVTNSGGEGEYFADKAEQAGIPMQPFSADLTARVKAEFPNFSHVGNPADCWAIDDDRIVFPRIFELMAESGEFDVLVSAIDHSVWLHGGERELATNIANDLRAAVEGSDLFPCVITVTHADPPIEDLEWAREHDIPVLKGSLPGLRALAARIQHEAWAPPQRRLEPAAPFAGSGALAELDSVEIARSYGLDYVKAERCASAARGGCCGRADRLSGRRQGRQRRPQGAGRRCRPQPDRCGGGAGCRRAHGRPGDRGRAGVGGRRGAGGRGARSRLRPDRRGRPRWRAGRSARPGHRRPRAGGRCRRAAAGGQSAGARRLLPDPVPQGLIDAIVAVSRMAAEHPEIAEIDVNPLLVSAERAVALDCLIVIQEES